MDIISIDRANEQFPSRLDRLTDSPTTLNVWGTIPSATFVAIVGTRKADAKMRRFTSDLAFSLSRMNIGIISGGAIGIDSAAHRGVLEAGGETVAVLGSGFDYLFPKKNIDLFAQIAKSGAVISEYPNCTPPTRWTFPKRNRIVAAMASAVVVIQAPSRSGSMITARIAREIGVPIGAVPGNPMDDSFSGCNSLIRGGASLISCAEEVVELIGCDSYCQQLDLPGTVKQGMESFKKYPRGLSPLEQRIWDQLSLDSVHIDKIAQRTQLPVQEINAAVLNLELSGFIEDLGGRRFVRT